MHIAVKFYNKMVAFISVHKFIIMFGYSCSISNITHRQVFILKSYVAKGVEILANVLKVIVLYYFIELWLMYQCVGNI